MRKVLEVLRPLTAERLIVVFGSAGERDPTKRAPMGRVAAELADLVVVTDEDPAARGPADDQRADRRWGARRRRRRWRDAVGHRRPTRGHRARHRRGARGRRRAAGRQGPRAEHRGRHRVDALGRPGRGPRCPGRGGMAGRMTNADLRAWRVTDPRGLECVRRASAVPRLPAAVGVGRGPRDGRLAAGSPGHRPIPRRAGRRRAAAAPSDPADRVAPGIRPARTDRPARRPGSPRRARSRAARAGPGRADRHRPCRSGGSPRHVLRRRPAAATVARRAEGAAADHAGDRPHRGRGGAQGEPEAEAPPVREQGRASGDRDRAPRRVRAAGGHRLRRSRTSTGSTA